MISDELNRIADEIRTEFDETDRAREKTLETSREIIRNCAHAIRAVHREEFEEAERQIAETSNLIQRLKNELGPHQNLWFTGFAQDALKEFVEALTTSALVRGLPLPLPREVGLGGGPYVNGLAETVGELRRHILDNIRKGETEKSVRLLDDMDEIYHMLMTLDYPDAVTQGLRKRSDSVRGIIERTRGDLTFAIRQHVLAQSLEQFEKRVAGGL